MKRLFSPFATAAHVAILSLVVGCSGQDESPPEDSDDDAPAGNSNRDAGGSSARDAGRDAGRDLGRDAGSDAARDAGRNTNAVDAGKVDGGSTTGNASDSGSGSAVPATFETLKLVITETTCFGAGCHNDEQNPLNLRVDDQLYKRLTTLKSENCGNLPMVNPGKPQESAIIKIFKGPCGETPRMPLGCVDDEDATCVPPEYIAAISQWIASGAAQK